MISKETLKKFKAIWKEEFEEEISDIKALDSAMALVTLMTERRNSGKRGGASLLNMELKKIK